MKKLVLLSAVLLGTAVASQAGVQFNLGIGFPFPRHERVIVSRPAPYCEPAPVYVAPRYCPPPQVVYAPRCEPPRYYYSQRSQPGHHGWGDRDRRDHGRDRHDSHRR